MKREQLMHNDFCEAANMLRTVEYKTTQMAKRFRSFAGRFADIPNLLDDLTLSAMGMGHIELAEELIASGARPGSGDRKISLAGDFHATGHYIDARGLTVLHLLAVQDCDSILTGSDRSWKRRPRVEVLDHVLANPDIWGGEVDAIYRNTTALIWSQSVDKHAGSLKYFPAGMLQNNVDLRERAAFQKALIQAGANINHPGAAWSFLAASIPMAPPDGRQDTLDMSEIARALALGADPVLGAPGAWAQAIVQDGPNNYIKGQGKGQRGWALVKAGIDLDARPDDRAEISPVYRAFTQNAAWAVKELVERGVDIGAWRDKETGRSILHTIPSLKKSASKLLDMVPQEQLAGAVDARGPEMETPLHEAVAKLDPDLVKRYLALGADPGALNKKNQKPIEAIRVITDKMQPKFEAVFALLDDPQASPHTQAGTTALHKAALMLSSSTCRTLIERGWPIDARDSAGNTPLDAALFGHQQSADALFNENRGRKQVEILNLFAEHGVDLFAKRNLGRTLLHEVMGYGNHRVAIALLQAGADPNAEDDMGLTPMHMWGISEHLREQKRNNPNEVAAKTQEGLPWTLSTRSIEVDHHEHIQELFKAFMEAGGQVRSERFGLPAFGHIWENRQLASALDSIEMEVMTPKAADAPMRVLRL